MTGRDATEARREVLRRAGLAAPARVANTDVPRHYRGVGSRSVTDPVGLFMERLADYRAGTHRCGSADVRAAIGSILRERGRTHVCRPADLPAGWVADPAWEVFDDGPPDLARLTTMDGVVTGCAVAIALTGTIVLDSGTGQGWRALTLIPDYHLVVVRAEDIVPGVPDALARLEPTRPMTWISGPSATSDIEFERVEGVHGPRTLDVLVIEKPPAADPPLPSNP